MQNKITTLQNCVVLLCNTFYNILTIVNKLLLKTNINIHLIMSDLLSAISAFAAKFLYNTSLNIEISFVIIQCFSPTSFSISFFIKATNCSSSLSQNFDLSKLNSWISEINIGRIFLGLIFH